MANQPGTKASRGNNSEEIQLRGRARRRLVGAIAVVVIMVVGLPMVLDKTPKPMDQNIAINIPSQELPDAASRLSPPPAPAAAATVATGKIGEQQPAVPAVAPVQPVAAPAAAVTGPAANPAEPAKVPTPAAAGPVTEAGKAEAPKTPMAEKASIPADKPKDKTADKPAEKKAAEVADKPQEKKASSTADKAKESKTAAAAKPGKGGFAVQLGVFSSAANVKQLQAKLSSRSIRSYTETLKTSAGEKIRVRVGPYANRQDADKARDKLKAIGISGDVVANK